MTCRLATVMRMIGIGSVMAYRLSTRRLSTGTFLKQVIETQGLDHVRALDMFCCRGTMTREIRDIVRRECPSQSFEIEGIDEDPKNINHARNASTQITFRCGDITLPSSAPVPGLRIDGFDWFVFQHCEDRIRSEYVGFMMDRLTARTRYYPNPRSVCLIYRSSTSMTDARIRRQCRMYCTNPYDIFSSVVSRTTDTDTDHEHLTAVIIHPDPSLDEEDVLAVA